VGTIATTALLIVIMAAMLKIDWEKVITRYIERKEKKGRGGITKQRKTQRARICLICLQEELKEQ